jgi:glycosyltransferase involved in cell wall biosynthesis
MMTIHEALELVPQALADLYHADPVRWQPAILAHAAQRQGKGAPRPTRRRPIAPVNRVPIDTFLNSFSGFGRFTMHVGRALEAIGTPVVYVPTATDNRYAPVSAWQSARVELDPPEPWRLVMHYVGHGIPADSPAVLYTMHEASRLPGTMVEVANQCRGVIVPSRWCRQTFADSGVMVPIHVAPLGIDPDEGWSPRPRPDDGVFRVLVVGMTAEGGVRKRIGEAIRAFLAAFPTDPDVALTVKVWPSCLKDLPPLPMDGRISIIAAALPVHDLVELVQGHDAYLTATAGEGWGLPTIEAMACGLAPIATLATSHSEYLDDSVAWVAEHAATPAGGPYRGQGDWYPPDFHSLVRQLRSAHRDRDEHRRRGQAAAARARTFTWERTARCVRTALESIGFLAPVPPTDDELAEALTCPRRQRPPGCGCVTCGGGPHDGQKVQLIDCVLCLRGAHAHG